ncbi:MAG: hypothetical protein ACR2HO_01190 [Rubrobacteraceae bacterium]
MTGERNGARTATGHGRVVLVAGVTLLSLTIALVGIGAMLIVGGGGFGRIAWGLPGVSGLWALGFSVAGYPITRRHPANPVGWCLMAAGLAAGATFLGLSNAADSGGFAFWLSSAWVVSMGALCSAIVLFPSGSPPSRWWWAQLCVLWGSGFLAYFADPYETSGFTGLPGWLVPIAAPAAIVFQLSLVAGFFSLLARWRRSGSLERLQLKWVVYSVAVVGTTALIVETGISELAPAWYLSGTFVLSIVILAVPVAMGVAMLRYRLFDIDLVINRTLVYGALTATLALVYVGVVVSLQYAFRVLTGEGSQLVIVASTLGIAVLFNPLRSRIQDFVARLFYRKKYDAAKTLETFSAKLRDETDLHTLSDDLVTVVRDTVQPERVSLWLRESSDRGKTDG